jgi:hypothetical protein
VSKKKTNTGLGATGLGTSAFFRPTEGVTAEPQELPVEEKVAKMRTTVMLSPEVVAGIETLRAQSRRKGQRLTTGEIIDDALRMFLRERKVMP